MSQETSPQEPRVLAVHFASRRALLTRLKAESRSMSLFVATEERLVPGQWVKIQLNFSDSDARFTLLGRVTFRRAQVRGSGQEAGVGISFEGEEKRRAAEVLTFCAGKPAGTGVGSTRTATAIRCLVRGLAGDLVGEVRDLSSSGVFVTVPRLGMRVGQELVLQLEPMFSRWGGRKVPARVIWVGNKLGKRGFGARFVAGPDVLLPVLRRYLPPAASAPRAS